MYHFFKLYLLHLLLAPSVYDQCNGTHYTCPQGDKMIARAFMCDSVPDCEPNGDDESECSKLANELVHFNYVTLFEK